MSDISISAYELSMRSHALYLPALALTSVCAVIVPISPFVEPVFRMLVRPFTWAAGGVAAVLFLQMLFDPRCHRGIAAANLELKRNQPFRLRGPKLTDPNWGVFGSRIGPRPLQVIRAGLAVEFVLALVLTRRNSADILLLASAGFGVTMLLSLVHVGLNMSDEVG